MPTKAQKVRLGIFIFSGVLALILLLLVIGSEQIFKEKDIYYISYQDVSVSGLEVGSPVKYLGVGIGTISEIHIDSEDVSRIVVTVALEPGTPIKSDAKAGIAAIGITGLKMIEIRGGSNESDVLEPGQMIASGGSFSEEITGKAEIIAEKIELVLNNLNRFTEPENMNKIITLAESATQTFDNVNGLVADNRSSLAITLENASRLSTKLDTIGTYLLQTVSEIRRLTLSDTLGRILSNVSEVTMKLKRANLLDLIDQLSEAVQRTNNLLRHIDHDVERSSEDVWNSVRSLRSTMKYLEETTRLINEDPSVLIRGTDLEDIPDEELDQ